MSDFKTILDERVRRALDGVEERLDNREDATEFFWEAIIGMSEALRCWIYDVTDPKDLTRLLQLDTDLTILKFALSASRELWGGQSDACNLVYFPGKGKATNEPLESPQQDETVSESSTAVSPHVISFEHFRGI